jgi:hypothetical protein
MCLITSCSMIYLIMCLITPTPCVCLNMLKIIFKLLSIWFSDYSLQSNNLHILTLLTFFYPIGPAITWRKGISVYLTMALPEQFRKQLNPVFRAKVQHDAEFLVPGQKSHWNQRTILVLVGASLLTIYAPFLKLRIFGICEFLRVCRQNLAKRKAKM